jgi:hypothetical protein
MGISNSDKLWTAGALLFSGRPNPVWQLAPELARDLIRLWSRLPPLLTQRSSSRPRLGYSGCFLRSNEGEQWQAFGTSVTRTHLSLSETRFDQEKRFEKTLLSSAPDDLLPESVRCESKPFRS